MTPFMSGVLLAVLMPALEPPSITAAADVPEAAECVGRLTGDRLSTTVQLRDGSTWVAPWRIVHRVPMPDGGEAVLALLDRIVRVQGGDHTVMLLPQRVAATVRAPSADEAVRRTAELWCGSVIRATATPDRAAGPPLIIAGGPPARAPAA